MWLLGHFARIRVRVFSGIPQCIVLCVFMRVLVQMHGLMCVFVFVVCYVRVMLLFGCV